MERPRIVNRITYEGDRSLAVTHKKAAVRLLDSCRLHASFSRLGTYNMRKEMDDGTIIEAQIVGGVPSARVIAPFGDKAKTEKAWKAPVFVVVVGNEVIGYKVALVPTVKDATPKLKKMGSMNEIMRVLPPVNQRERYVRRYSVKTDLRSYETGEPFLELYVPEGESTIQLFPGEKEVLGPRCDPETFQGTHCPYSPVNPIIVTCHEEVASSTGLLDQFAINGLEHFIDLGYTARAWNYQRQNQSSYWAEKREATYSATAAPTFLSFGVDLVRRRGFSAVIESPGDSLTTYGLLTTQRWRCTDEWTDIDFEEPFEAYGLIAMVCLTVERINTPVGRAIVLSDKTPILSAIHGVYNSDPDQFTMGKSEPMTYPIESEVYDSVIGEKDECISNPSKPLKMYSYTRPDFFHSWGESYKGKFVSPLTKYITSKNTPAFIAYSQQSGTSGLTYNNVLFKNISFAAEHDTGVVEVYFKSFLEAEFSYNEDTEVFDKTAIRQVAVGASGYDTDYFLHNLRRVFETFRADDLQSGLLTVDSPEAVKGTIMAYLFDWQEDGAGMLDDLEVFDRINDLRGSLGLAPLAWSHDLSVAARIHAEDMATHHFLGHIGSDNSVPGQRIDGTGFSGLAREHLIIGENCAAGQDTAALAVEAWINSPPHYAAMVHPQFLEIGIGLCLDETGKAYWCTTFAGDADA